MEIADFIKARNDLEQELRTLIQDRCDRFRQETSIPVDSIQVQMTRHHYFEQQHPTATVDRVWVSAPLEG